MHSGTSTLSQYEAYVRTNLIAKSSLNDHVIDWRQSVPKCRKHAALVVTSSAFAVGLALDRGRETTSLVASVRLGVQIASATSGFAGVDIAVFSTLGRNVAILGVDGSRVEHSVLNRGSEDGRGEEEYHHGHHEHGALDLEVCEHHLVVAW